ncbi:unnamed protein product [Clavelina lepadiformis]|uniref:Peroxisomal bifunctional enzyme n=2 Tax=Clavelina lepadiformis TaxID=159417 RepID=A0ABP0F9R8_CLALP
MANYSVRNQVAIISLCSPPVNALSSDVRRGILDSLKKAEQDVKVAAIVICGEGRTFCVGADITEFKSEFKTFPNLFELVDILESSPKPIVAAIHGHAFGGGLEVALACHYRVALSSAKLALPEVKLGILPGAGGTQRLPRLIGIDSSMQWIAFGDEYSAQIAANIGIIDRIFPSNADILESAVQYAQSIIGKSLINRRVSKLPVKDASKVSHIMEKYKQIVGKKSRGAIAPMVCLEAIKHAALLPYVEGMKKERMGIEALMGSDQSKSLIYMFFAERQVRNWTIPGTGINSKNTKPIKVEKVAVIGLGTMGRGIVLSLLKAGIKHVSVMELNKTARENGLLFIKNILEGYAARGTISETQKRSMVDALKPVSNFEMLKDTDLVIEAVFESMSIKKDIFAKLGQVCKPSAVLATNTSALDVDEIAMVTPKPKQVVGMHFFAPAHVMKLLENVRGSKSSPQVIATAMNMGQRMGKVTVLVGNCHGFVGNRMFRHYTVETDFMLEEGAYPEQVDTVLKKFGFAMGRYQVGDLSGNDIGYRMRTKFEMTNKQQPPGAPERERHGVRYCPLADFLVESGRLGYKSDGKGWFRYLGKNRELTVDNEVTSMIDSYRRRNKIVPRKINGEEIIERALYPLINEGFKILEEGIASNPMEIDLILVHGYAWPRHTGGPMFYAHLIGLPKILRVIERHWNNAGLREPHWEPSKMLVRLVKNHGNPDIMSWTTLERETVRSAL